MPIQGQKVGSIKKLKQMTKGGGGGTYLKYIPKNDSVMLRFLTEPEEFVGYYEHYDATMRKSYPCMGEEVCPGCATDEDRSFVYLAAAVDRSDDKVIMITLKKSVVNDLVLRYEKYDTVMDRDYEISRVGEGREGTKYIVSPEPPSAMKLSKYDVPDLMEGLEKAFETVHGSVIDEDDDDDETPAPKGKIGKAAVAKKSSKKPEPEPEEEEDDSLYTAEQLSEMDEDELQAIADVYEIDTEAYETWKDVENAILEAQDDDAAAADDDDDDDDDDTDDTDDTDDDDSEDDDGDEPDDDDFWTQEELEAKTIGELRAIAKDYEIPSKGKKPAQLIAAILAESGE